MGELGIPRRESRRLRLRRDEQRRVRAGHAGAGARRLRPAQLRERAGRAGDVSDPDVTAARNRSSAGCRSCNRGEAIGCFGLTEPGFGSNPAGMLTRARRDGVGLGAERREDLDHQRIGGGCRGGVGARRGRHPRISGGDGHAWIHVVGDSRKAVDAGVGDVEPGVQRLPRAGERDAAGREGAEGSARLPDAGALRDRMGRDRRGDGLL